MDENETCWIFNLVHGSFVDGPGIRSTVFLKGCPLRCLWCCNPEGQNFRPELRVTESRCLKCGDCEAMCPSGAIQVSERLQIRRDLCDGCGRCTKACDTGALELFGRRMSVREVFEDIARDKLFYDASGGGLTIGGGEASCHPAFVLALISLCRRADIHVAVDTCGYTLGEENLEVLRQADLLLYDIKGIDETAHWRNTGVSNRRILENLRALDEAGVPIIVRIPVIPEHNASEMADIAEVLKSLHCLQQVDLICYHEYGRGKYAQLGRPYSIRVPRFTPEEEREILKIFTDRGLPAQLGGG